MRFTLFRGSQGGNRVVTIIGIGMFVVLVIAAVIMMLKKLVIVAIVLFSLAICAIIASAFEFDSTQIEVPNKGTSGTRAS